VMLQLRNTNSRIECWSALLGQCRAGLQGPIPVSLCPGERPACWLGARLMAVEKQVNNLAAVAPAYLSLRYVRTSIEGAEHGERDGWQGFKGQTGCPPGSLAPIENVRPFVRFGATIADSPQARRGSRTGKNWLLEGGGPGRRRRVDPPRFRARGADISSGTPTMVSFFCRSGMPRLARPTACSLLS